MLRLPHIVLCVLLAAATSACSFKHIAVSTVGDMLASGESIYASEDDIVLVGEALPFSLKLADSLLLESPEHRGLLLSASQGYVLYAYAFVHHDAELAAVDDLEHARILRQRAKKLYLRAFNYATRVLEISYPGFARELANTPAHAVTRIGPVTRERDVAPMYWCAASLGLAISAAKEDAAMLARLPEVEALLDRALLLDEAWNRGALHEFKITWASAQHTRPDEAALRRHYARALELSGGKHASLFVALAEAVAIPNQDRAEFRSLLEKALAVDIDADPNHRLMNVIAQRRAKWLLHRSGELFL